MVYPSQLFARYGRECREAHGPPPLALGALIRHIDARYGVSVYYDPGLPMGMHGMARRRRKHAGRRGYILIQPASPYKRWVIGHELGHLMTESTYPAEFCLSVHADDVSPTERAASDWAATWLLDIDSILGWGDQGQDAPEMGAAADVPPRALFLRVELAHLLGEFSPTRYDAIHAALRASFGPFSPH